MNQLGAIVILVSMLSTAIRSECTLRKCAPLFNCITYFEHTGVQRHVCSRSNQRSTKQQSVGLISGQHRHHCNKPTAESAPRLVQCHQNWGMPLSKFAVLTASPGLTYHMIGNADKGAVSREFSLVGLAVDQLLGTRYAPWPDYFRHYRSPCHRQQDSSVQPQKTKTFFSTSALVYSVPPTCLIKPSSRSRRSRPETSTVPSGKLHLNLIQRHVFPSAVI